MKTFTSLSIGLLLCISAAQATPSAIHRLGVGMRYHVEHDDTEREVAFDDESTYGLLYEYHEANVFWQLGAQYGTSLGTNNVDTVITPEINLLFSDGGWRGGIGALSTYSDSDGESDWSDIYYQFIIGFNIPMGSLSINLQTAYVFEDFDNLDEFDFDELDWSGYLMYQF